MSEENKALMRRFFEEVFSRRNLAAADEFIDSNYVDHNPMPGQAPGLDGFKQMMSMFFNAFPDMQVTAEDMIAEGDKVVTRMTARGTHSGEFMGVAPTGKQITIKGIDINRVAGSKMTEHWEEFDMLGLMQQLGMVPPPGQ